MSREKKQHNLIFFLNNEEILTYIIDELKIIRNCHETKLLLFCAAPTDSSLHQSTARKREVDTKAKVRHVFKLQG